MWIRSRLFSPALASQTSSFCNLGSGFCFPPTPLGRPLSRDLNIAVARLTPGGAKVRPSLFMQSNGKADGSDCRVAQRFAILKQGLLLECLNATPGPETHSLIMRQANEAALLAWRSSYPLLTFPSLFEERSAAAAEQARRQARLYWKGLEAATPARAA